MAEHPANPLCPRCVTPVGADSCPRCGLRFIPRGRMLDVLGEQERERAAGNVEAFYTESPFPGYAPGDDGALLIDRCRRSGFLSALDAALPLDARILDVGCGTGQIPNFLALQAPRRQILGIDGCRASLTLAEEFRQRARLDNLQFVRADLFDLPVESASYHYVCSRGVVHHTPDPAGAIRSIVRCVAPGGFLVLGFYETQARAFHSARRSLGKLIGRPLPALDPVLTRRDLDDEKKRIWIQDQYYHPLEHILPLPRVVGWLEALGLRWVRTIPPVPERATFFEPTPEPSTLGMASLRLSWALSGIRDPDAGLICLVAQRHPRR